MIEKSLGKRTENIKHDMEINVGIFCAPAISIPARMSVEIIVCLAVNGCCQLSASERLFLSSGGSIVTVSEFRIDLRFMKMEEVLSNSVDGDSPRAICKINEEAFKAFSLTKCYLVM